MLWFILIFLVLMAVSAVLISARNQSTALDALAMHEKLKRNHPEDALAQVGPNEFQRAFQIVQRKRGQKVSNRGFLWFFLGLFANIPIGFTVSLTGSETLSIVIIIMVPIAFAWYGARAARAKLPELFDHMRSELQLG